MRRTLLFLPLLLSSALIIGIGCGKSTNDPIVAKVGDEEIAISVINNFFNKIAVTFASAEDEFTTRRDALDSLIDYKLLVRGAYAASLDKDSEIDKLVNSEKANFMFDELYRQEILPKIAVTDKEVEEFFERLKVEYHLAHIMVNTEKEADSVLAEIKKGTDFGMIARAVSQDQSSAVSGGDLGFVSWGYQFEPAFRDAAFNLNAGQVSNPVKTQFGWHVIKLLETREVPPQGDMQQMLPAIRNLLQSRKSNEVESAFLKQIEEKAHVEVNLEATQMLLDRLNQFYPKAVGQAQRPDNFFPQTELLKPFELQMVLASYQGGEVTVEDYLKKIANVAEAYRPRFDNPDSLKKVIFQLELRNVMEFEASQRNVEEQPEYKSRMRDFREGLMADRFVRVVLGKGIDVNEIEVMQYYNSHLEEFTPPREFHLLEIEVDSGQQASQLLAQLRSGADFGDLAARYTVRSGFREKRGDLGLVQPGRFPSLYEVALTMTTGQVSDTIRNDDMKYSIVKLVDIKESTARPLENIAGQVRSKVLAFKKSNATADWIKDQRAKTEIKVYEDVLRESVDKKKYEKS